MTVIVEREGSGHRAGGAPETALRRRNRRFRRWETTPEKLRLVQAVLVSACLLTGVVAAAALQARVSATREIEDRTEPLAADAVDAYRALANADATVATDFLAPGPTNSAGGSEYIRDIEGAAGGLARAATLTARHSLTADRISDIAAQLPTYTAFAEGALAAERKRDERASSLSAASSLMQSTILRRAETFYRIESERLDAQYRRAATLPVVALFAGAASVLALLGAQLMIARRTRRMVNLGLGGATVAVLALAVWWTVAVSASGDHLADSRRHSQARSAFGSAQIAARQARASEILALVEANPSRYEPDFSARMQRLARNDGAGGALGAARYLVSDQAGRETVTEIVNQARAWGDAHLQIVDLEKGGRHEEAAALAIGDGSSAAAFTTIDDALADAVTKERAAFETDVNQAQGALGGLVPGTVAGMVAAAAATAWGIGQRLKEYR